MASFKFRFRHLDGDVGPLLFTQSSSVGDMKVSVLAEWPNDGALSSKKPEGVAHLRIMYQGKILPDAQTISDLMRLPGEIKPDKVVTLHLLISPPGQHSGRRPNAKPSSSEPSCCTIQ